jgi:hypothetical protein
VYRWKNRRLKLGYKNYDAAKIIALFAVLGVLCGLLIGSLR